MTGAAIVLLSTGCTQSSEQPAEADPGSMHVHGIATDPDDPAALFAATHTGLFHVKDGVARRVGEAWHDLMGFTVMADGTFLASGHPDLQEERFRGANGLLGLVRSTDRGASWEPVALLGEADLHALAVAGSTILGADATGGTLLASTDGGISWEERSRTALWSLAANPTAPEVLVGVGEDGVVRSEDGGRTWTAVPGRQPGWVVAYATGFVLAQDDGRVLVSEDGRDWTEQGRLPGRPQAIGAGADLLHASVAERGLFTSADGGRTWTAVLEGH